LEQQCQYWSNDVLIILQNSLKVKIALVKVDLIKLLSLGYMDWLPHDGIIMSSWYTVITFGIMANIKKWFLTFCGILKSNLRIYSIMNMKKRIIKKFEQLIYLCGGASFI